MTETSSYVVGATDIVDPGPLADYIARVPGTIGRFGGRIRLAGPVTALEGPAPSIAAVIEFPDAIAAAAWYDSPEYAAIRALRQASGTSRVWLIEPPPDGAGPPSPAAHPNAELVRAGYDAFGRSDLPALLALFAPDIVWHVGGDGPLSGTHRGREAVRTLLATVFELTGGSQRLDVDEVFATDEHVVAVVHETATRARDGLRLDVREAHVMRLDRDRTVAEVWDVPDDPAAHDAFFS